MMWLLVLPILIPLATAAAGLVALRSRRVQRWLGMAGSTLMLASAILLLVAVWTRGILVLSVGSWPAPFGITFVVDHLAAAMVLVASLTAFAVSLYSLADIDRAREAFGYYPLFHVLMVGVNGAFLTGDIFNLYVWFEVMLVASFVLLALGGGARQMRAAMQYVSLNLVSSVLFLTAVGVLFGITGSLNMAALAVRLREVNSPGLVTTTAMLFLAAFGIKAALFPLFFWLPASYHTPPVAVSAIFAGLLTKVGVYALIRVFTLLFTQDVGYTHDILLVIAGLTMITGVLGAAAQSEFRRILSFHIISQIGYMIMGLALFTPLALAGAVFYVIHHIVVKTNLFLVSGVVQRVLGSFELDRLGGLYRSRPWLAALFLVPAFSLAGFPPLSGFWAKLILIRAGLDIGQYAIVAVALLVGMLTLFSMTKIWAEAFWKPAPDPAPAVQRLRRSTLVPLVGPVVLLATITLAIGLYASPLLALAARAAAELLDPAAYIRAVLGDVT